MNNADHAVLTVLYNIMSFTYASKNSADTSKVSATISKANMHLRKAFPLKKKLERLNLHDGQKEQNCH